MRYCLRCQLPIATDVESSACPLCGSGPTKVDGVTCYAPELTRESPGFRPEHFARLAQVEDDNFWFRARNELIVYVLRKYFPDAQNMLEIGCGTGYVLRGVTRAIPSLHVSGSEIFLEGLKFAAQRVPDADLFQMDARHIPYAAEFDLIGAFDVIEHIQEDEQVLHEIQRALRPGGGAVFTVPQHPSLWSAQDDQACHVRRYRHHELTDKLKAAGFQIRFSTSFVSLLLPMLAASRWRKPSGSETGHDEFPPPAPVNSALYSILHFEALMIRAGMRFPIGGTRLVAAMKAA